VGVSREICDLGVGDFSWMCLSFCFSCWQLDKGEELRCRPIRGSRVLARDAGHQFDSSAARMRRDGHKACVKHVPARRSAFLP